MIDFLRLFGGFREIRAFSRLNCCFFACFRCVYTKNEDLQNSSEQSSEITLLFIFFDLNLFASCCGGGGTEDTRRACSGDKILACRAPARQNVAVPQSWELSFCYRELPTPTSSSGSNINLDGSTEDGSEPTNASLRGVVKSTDNSYQLPSWPRLRWNALAVSFNCQCTVSYLNVYASSVA